MNDELAWISHGAFFTAGVLLCVIAWAMLAHEPRCQSLLLETVQVRYECALTARQCLDTLQVCEHARVTATTLLKACEASAGRLTDMVSNRASCWTPTETEWIE
jgi:hypothetical protein